MSELVVVNIDRVGGGDDWPAVLQISYDIIWPDLELLLKLHLDCTEIKIQYVDEENDHVSVNSNEELQEAFKVAKKCGNVLNLKITPPNETESASPFNTMDSDVGEILLDTRSHTVAMKVPQPDKITIDLTVDDNVVCTNETGSNKTGAEKPGQVACVINEDNGEVVCDLPKRGVFVIDGGDAHGECTPSVHQTTDDGDVQEHTDQELLNDISILEIPSLDQPVKDPVCTTNASLEASLQGSLSNDFVKPDVQAISISSGDESMDGDFYIVPLPDCFQLDKPITQSDCESNQNENAAATPKPGLVTLQDENSQIEETEVHVVEDELPDGCEVEGPEELFEDTSEDIVILEDEPVISDSSSTSSDIPDETPAASELNQLPQVQYTDEENNNNLTAPVHSAEDQDSTSVKTVDDGDQSCPSSPTVVASNLMKSAVSAASNAAAAAYSTAKDVFHTLQARNQYSQPKSNWQPKDQDWTPPKDDWMPAKSTWTPSESTWAPPAASNEDTLLDRHNTSMEQLIEMGFGNRSVNQELLRKHNDDIHMVIQELITQEDNDWQSNRH